MSEEQNSNLLDPLQAAIKVTQMDGSLKVLEEKFATGFSAIGEAIRGLQLEQRETTKILAEISKHQMTMQTQSEGLERAFKAIKGLGDNFDIWRREHESQNKTTDEKVIAFKGMMKGGGIVMGAVFFLTGALVSAVLYSYNLQLTSTDKNISRVELLHNTDVSRLQKQIDIAAYKRLEERAEHAEQSVQESK